MNTMFQKRFWQRRSRLLGGGDSRKGAEPALWFTETINLAFEGLTSQAKSIPISAPFSSHFDRGFIPIRTLLMARWINHASLFY
jgi:hypothetical protein